MAEFDIGIKELEHITLKATYDMDIGNLHFSEGEVITEFDSIQLANFSELRQYITAHGGYQDQTRVVWDTMREMRFQFSKGVFNRLQFGILQNAKIIELDQSEGIILTEVEHLESNENGEIQPKYQILDHLSIRDNFGVKLTYTYNEESNIITISESYKNVVISYDFKYTGNATYYRFGKRFLNGYVALEARTKVKDDITGQTHTGIIKIPKLKLTSDLSMRLGQQANPLLGDFSAIGYPSGSREGATVMELFFLSDDIDSDIN